MRFNRPAGCLAMLALAAAGQILSAEPALAADVDQKIAADLHGTVEVSNSTGKIRCIGWDKPEVRISGIISGGGRLDVRQQGTTTIIGVVSRMGVVTHDEAELEIHLPADSRLRASAVSADIEVSGVNGDQRLQTVSGDIRTEAGKADLVVKSISGSLDVKGKREPIHISASTVSGDTTIGDVGGELELDTVSGDSNIDMTSLTRARLQTVSGDLDMKAQLAPDVRIDASSVSGTLELRWPGAEASNIELATFSGDISACFGGTPVQRATYGPGSTWRYGVKDAKGSIRVKSMSGDIHLCNR